MKMNLVSLPALPPAVQSQTAQYRKIDAPGASMPCLGLAMLSTTPASMTVINADPVIAMALCMAGSSFG